jgi:hypothetical protein
MTDQELQEIRGRVAGTTPPPWHSNLHFTEKDMVFIAHANEDVAKLLAEIDRLRAENEELRSLGADE